MVPYTPTASLVVLPLIHVHSFEVVGVGVEVRVCVEVNERAEFPPPHPLMTIAREKTTGRQRTTNLRM
jgi:hypothetical protein